MSPLLFVAYPKSKSEAISSSCFGYKNKTTWKSISFWQVDIVHKLIIFKLTPNDFRFKLKPKYMFGILITSAVNTWRLYTWQFFFSDIFFYGGNNWLNGPQRLARGEWRSGETLRWRREKEEKSHHLSDRQTPSILQFVCGGRSVTRTLICPFPSFLLWEVEVVEVVGRLSSLFWCCLWWSRWSGTTLSFCWWRLTGWGHKCPAVVTKRHKLKRAG